MSYYLSSVLGLKEAFLLLLTPIARIWDGINDPMMGTIVDNTRTKHGKYRPWILIGAICNAVVLFLLFTSFGMSGTRLYIYIGVMYILWGMTNTMADIPYWSMVPSFTSDPNDRNLVSTVARTFSGRSEHHYCCNTYHITYAFNRYDYGQGLQRNRIFTLGRNMRNFTCDFLSNMCSFNKGKECCLRRKGKVFI